MGFQDILVLIQTIICAVSLIVSLVALNTANNVKKKIEKKDSHDNKNSKQVAFGSGISQTIKK